MLEQPQVFNNGLDFVAVERQCLLQLVEDADEIQNESVRLDHLRLFVFVRPVHAGDSLQQRVIAHRLVQIHRVEDRRIETGEQFFRDDQNFRPLAGLREILANLFLLLPFQMPLFQVGRVVVVSGEDNLRIL